MSEIGGYTTHLYCDVKGCNRSGDGGSLYASVEPQELYGQTRNQCRRTARQLGWTFHPNGQVTCRDHTRKDLDNE